MFIEANVATIESLDSLLWLRNVHVRNHLIEADAQPLLLDEVQISNVVLSFASLVMHICDTSCRDFSTYEKFTATLPEPNNLP